MEKNARWVKVNLIIGIFIIVLLSSCSNKNMKNMEKLEKFDIEFYEGNQEDGFCEFWKEDTLVSMFQGDGYYCVQETPKYPKMVCLQKIYNESTLYLTSKGNYLKYGGTAIGTWSYYDDDGNFIKEEDKDTGYRIKWEDLLKIFKDKDIPISSITSISRYIAENKIAEWVIYLSLSPDLGETLIFNATTGELISREKEVIMKNL